MEILQVALALVGAVAGLVGTVALTLRLSAKQRDNAIEREQRRTDQLIAELRRDLRSEQDAHANTRTLVATLQDERQKADVELVKLRNEIDVLCRSLQDLQTWKGKAQADIEAKSARIEELTHENRRLENALIEAQQRTAVLTTEKATYERALTLLGLDLADRRDGAQSGAEQSTDKEAKKVGT